jgi:hypothetical protein
MIVATVDLAEPETLDTTTFRDMARSARMSGRHDVLIRLDRLSDLRTPADEAAGKALMLEIVELLEIIED